MSRNREPESKRVRQACLNCRRKKTRCPGDKPACAFCVRLGQTCQYADATTRRPSFTRITTAISTITADTSASDGPRLHRCSISHDANSSFHASDGDDGHELNGSHPAISRPLMESQMSAPVHAIPDMASEVVDHEAHAARFKQVPPLHVLTKLIDVYFTHCQNQPYCLFHEGNMRQRLKSGDVPEYLIFVIAACATRYSLDEYFKPLPLIAVASYAREAWIILQKQVFDNDSFSEIEAAQAAHMLAIIDFTSGQHRRGWVKIGLAIRLVQDLKRNVEPDTSIPKWQQEERRRVFWSVYLLDRWFACSNARPVGIVDTDCTVRLPCNEETFRVGSAVSDMPSLAVLSTAWQSDVTQRLDGLAILVLMCSLLGRTVRYTSRESAIDVPCWDPRSEFADIASQLMSFERMHLVGSEDLAQHIDDLYGTYEGYDRQRAGLLVWSRAMYHLCGVMLYRPWHLYKHRRRWRDNFPNSFAQDALDRCQRHMSEMTRILAVVLNTGCCARGSSMGYLACCCASMHKTFLHSPDEATAARSADGLDTCLRFLQQPPLPWPHFSRMASSARTFDVEPNLARHFVDPRLPPTLEIGKAESDKLQSILDYAWLSDSDRDDVAASATSYTGGDVADWAVFGDLGGISPFYGLSGSGFTPSIL